MPDPTDLRYPDARPDCRHQAGSDCPDHGCPHCRNVVEQENYYAEACWTCMELRHADHTSFAALNPAMACELAEALHCLTCGRCRNDGVAVCSRCLRCPAHDDDPDDRCVTYRAGGAIDAAYVVHEIPDASGRWVASRPSRAGHLDVPVVPPTAEVRERRSSHYGALTRVPCRVFPDQQCISCGPDADRHLEEIRIVPLLPAYHLLYPSHALRPASRPTPPAQW
ncbi:MAG: hypothetical protein CMH83_19075 [Nocardioides sp.]|nr:hypothetical protein [Nocardioides sp.]